MVKVISAMLLFSLNMTQIPQRNLYNKEYLITGQNTIQKIYYVTTSYFSSTYRGDKAMDSDLSTSWVSKKSGGAHYFEIDFGIKRIISSIVVYPGKKDNYRTLKYFILQFMYEDRWFDYAYVKLEESGWFFKKYKNKAVIDLGGIDASTFRIYIPPDATYNGYAAIAEIETHIGSSKIKYFDERVKGLYLPIKNGFLPEQESSYPNSPRKYRGGRHVGLDIFYYHDDESYNPIPVTKKTPIYAADKGQIIRVDWDYKPMSIQEWKMNSNYFKSHPNTYVKRSFGGIQVWIDHMNGIVTTYNHLSKIDSSIKKGSSVKKGQRIGWVGNSGLFGEAEGKNYGIHLHFEIWIDGFYLGTGMPYKDVKKYITWIFFPLQ